MRRQEWRGIGGEKFKSADWKRVVVVRFFPRFEKRETWGTRYGKSRSEVKGKGSVR